MTPDRNFVSNINEFSSFISSSVWFDFKNELEYWIVSLQDQLEVQDDVNEIRRIQGRLSALREVLDFPTQVISAFESRLIEEG